MTIAIDSQAGLHALDQAVAEGWLLPSAAENIRLWLTEPRYANAVPEVQAHLLAKEWAILNDVFWMRIPFGTAGRRGRMYPIGTNAINEQSIAETAAGLAQYILATPQGNARLGCAVAYDTRHRSREFAELCCEVMAGAGFVVYFLDGCRSTPELAFTVISQKCACGLMVSASHNPPTDNAVKVFWSSGGQLRPPHDQGVMESIAQVRTWTRRPFTEAARAGAIVSVQDKIDEQYQAAVLARSHAGPRDLKIVYSPLHGVGLTSVLPVLTADGFQEVDVFAPHATPDGDFPNVPGNVANPENPAVFESIITHAQKIGADLALASDPDADRIGCAAPLAPGGAWRALSGNQIAVLLADYLLRQRCSAGGLHADAFIIKTLVTTEMLRRVANLHGVKTVGDVLTGFKWIGAVVDALGADRFVFGAEEAHGYLVGDYVRDKDAAGAAMALAELAAEIKPRGRTLWQELDRFYRQVGYHAELTVSRTLPGAEGMSQMRSMMERLRSSPPQELAGMKVVKVRDYLRDESLPLFSGEQPIGAAERDLLIFDLSEEGNYAAVRPSGTEPKLKFYLFAYRSPEASPDLTTIKLLVAEQLARMERDLLAVTSSA